MQVRFGITLRTTCNTPSTASARLGDLDSGQPRHCGAAQRLVPHGRRRPQASLAAWVREGGQLVAVGGACSAFSGQEGWGLKRYAEGERAEVQAEEARIQEATDERNAHDNAAQGLDPLPFSAQGRDRLRYDLPGAIFSAAVDDTHPLADGYGSKYMTLRTSGRRFAALEEGNVAVLPPGRPRPPL